MHAYAYDVPLLGQAREEELEAVVVHGRALFVDYTLLEIGSVSRESTVWCVMLDRRKKHMNKNCK